MARMDHVMQIGKPAEAPKIYLEDYAYTYLKRQQDKEKNKYYLKYFLYGEREGSREKEKLYIYGISDSPKEEHTYFKDYYPLGFLKIREGEKFLVNRKGQEKPLPGFFVFYAPNQSMQEYLVDTSVGEKTEAQGENKSARQFSGKRLPVRDKIVFAPPNLRKVKKGINFSNLIFYAGCIAVLLLLGMAVSGGNGYHKLAAFKQMVMQTMNSLEEENQEEELIVEEFVVEEQRIGNEPTVQNTVQESDPPADTTPSVEKAESQSTLSDTGTDTQATETGETESEPADAEASEAEKEVISNQVSAAETSDKQQEKTYESYIVKEGDTLAKICQTRYGSTERMQEICDYNNIVNADHIAPGQKLYLP